MRLLKRASSTLILSGNRFLDCARNDVFLCPHQELNLDLRFRKPLFYPLNYGSDSSILAYFNLMV